MPNGKIGQAVGQEVDEVVDATTKQYEDILKQKFADLEKETEDRLKKLEEQIEKQVKSRSITIILAVVGLAVLAFLVSMIGWTSQVNGAVIGLQKDVIGAQTAIRAATKDLDDLASRFKNAQTTAETELNKATAKLDIARDQLRDTKATYEQRLKEMQAK